MNHSVFLNFFYYSYVEDRTAILTEIIYKNPGLHYSEIIRVSGMKNGVLSHYLNKLESSGMINVQRAKDKTRFFSPKISNEEVKIIKFLRKDTSQKIIFALMKKNLKFKEVANIISKSIPTTSQNLSELIKHDIVAIKFENSQKKYFIKKNPLLIKLIKKYQFH